MELQTLTSALTTGAFNYQLYLLSLVIFRQVNFGNFSRRQAIGLLTNGTVKMQVKVMMPTSITIFYT
jgi:hypothetical protein